MRFAAELSNPDAAAALRDDADALVEEVQELYVDGGGYWQARYPDGSLVPVRHCYDFLTVLATIAGDLTPLQHAEMAAFFERELRTPAWMHALSPADGDAAFSLRPDHQWNGAYTAWPALTAAGLYRIGREDLALPWFKALSRSANQGPFGQAHFVESFAAPEGGGALKASSDHPYINDWACSSSGAWSDVIISSIFGLAPGLGDELVARPRFGAFDPGARLRNIAWRGKLYEAGANGVREARS
jgi:hypothetical protein